MALYIAYNSALSATTAIAAGGSYATGAKCALQLGIPSGGQIELVQWGISMDASAAANGALVEIASTATASTMSSAHSTTTVKPVDDPNAVASRLTMGTGSTGYGNGAITSNTTLRMADRRYVPPTGSMDILIPLGMYPKFGALGAAEFLQFRINTTATVNAICYMVWRELI